MPVRACARVGPPFSLLVTVDTLIFHAVDVNNQPVIQIIAGVNNRNLSLNEVGIVLESGHWCV